MKVFLRLKFFQTLYLKTTFDFFLTKSITSQNIYLKYYVIVNYISFITKSLIVKLYFKDIV